MFPSQILFKDPGKQAVIFKQAAVFYKCAEDLFLGTNKKLEVSDDEASYNVILKGSNLNLLPGSTDLHA